MLPPKRSSGTQIPGKYSVSFAAPEDKLAVSAKMPNGKEHGLFTYLLLEALQHVRPGRPLSNFELKNYISQRFDEVAPDLMKRGIKVARPTHQGDDLIFGPGNAVSGPMVATVPIGLKFQFPAIGEVVEIIAGDLQTVIDRKQECPVSWQLTLPVGLYLVKVASVDIAMPIRASNPAGESYDVH